MGLAPVEPETAGRHRYAVTRHPDADPAAEQGIVAGCIRCGVACVLRGVHPNTPGARMSLLTHFRSIAGHAVLAAAVSLPLCLPGAAWAGPLSAFSFDGEGNVLVFDAQAGTGGWKGRSTGKPGRPRVFDIVDGIRELPSLLRRRCRSTTGRQ